MLEQWVFGSKWAAAYSKQTWNFLFKALSVQQKYKDLWVGLSLGWCPVWRHRKRKHWSLPLLDFPVYVTQQVHIRCHLPPLGRKCNGGWTKKKKVTAVFPIQLNRTRSVHLALGGTGRAVTSQQETVTQGTTWFLVCSHSRAPHCSLLVRICDKTISWPFSKNNFFHIYVADAFILIGGLSTCICLNLFFRKGTRIHLGKNWIYFLNKPKSLIKFFIHSISRTFPDYSMNFTRVVHLNFNILYLYLKCTEEMCQICCCM